MQPLTIDEATAMGVPECFSVEFAFLEGTGQLPPYAGPVEPDWGSDAYDLYEEPPRGFPNGFPEDLQQPTSLEELQELYPALDHWAAPDVWAWAYQEHPEWFPKPEPVVYCPEGNDSACPTPTCGCPPF
jgi:hypothetical protein